MEKPSRMTAPSSDPQSHPLSLVRTSNKIDTTSKALTVNSASVAVCSVAGAGGACECSHWCSE